jgi:cytochrome c oxidase subunit 4
MAHDPAHEHHANVDHKSMGIEHEHPTWSTYWKVALILTLITGVEVWIYYIPSIVASRLFVPALLIMSAVKFFTVVLFYMHLRYDHKLFRALFTGPLIIAAFTLVGLMFLFGKLSIGVGAPH